MGRPSIAVFGLIAFNWNEFIFALTISSQAAVTVPVCMLWAIDTRGVHFWTLGTRAMIAMLLPLILVLLAQRWIVRGMTMVASRGEGAARCGRAFGANLDPCYRSRMNEIDERARLAELTEAQPESTDPDYLAWVERRIVEAQEQLKDPAKRIPAAEVWKTLGVDPRV